MLDSRPQDRLTVTAPPAKPSFSRRGEVHLWLLSLTSSPPSEALLPPEERGRLKRFRQERDQRRFLHTHVATRCLLAFYLNQPPADLTFTSGPFGKPALAHSGSSLQFNLSHSGEQALLAISSDQEVGVDLECRNEDLDTEELATSLFTPEEHEAFQRLSPSSRMDYFFQIWSAKEAFVKCLGTGLNTDLGTVSLSPNLRQIQSTDREGASPHFLYPLSVHREYAAALCTPQPVLALECFLYQAPS